MTSPIAPDLGRLAAPGPGSPYDDVRLTLVDTILAAKAAHQLEHAAWQQAFEDAVRSLRMRLIDDAETSLRAAAARSRYPRRRRAALLPDAEAADTILQRLLAEGMPLERLEGLPDDPATRRARAAALEAAWEGAERVARSEAARQRALADRIAGWRRPPQTLWVSSAVIVCVAVLVAGWLGGQLPSPEWFRPVGELWWSLPWP